MRARWGRVGAASTPCFVTFHGIMLQRMNVAALKPLLDQ
jgi:hypothetical protein